MSDHLIAEANRHAKALTDERNNLVVELNMLREWQREVIQNEKAHHAEREDANARAELAEADLAAEREKVGALRLACERIVNQWDENHDCNPIGAGGTMYTLASKALAATEDAP